MLLPPYVIHRRTCYFSEPDSFLPDRWLQPVQDNKIVNEKSRYMNFNHNSLAFFPFSYGPAICVGKMLALQEIRVVVALILHRFDIRLPPDFDISLWEKSKRNSFVLQLGPLPVIVNPRA